MAEEKKKIVLLNRGTMTYVLPPLVEGGEKRILGPGGSIEAKDEKEAKFFLDYKGIVDAAKAVPQTQSQIEALEKEITRLRAENAALKEKVQGHAGGMVREVKPKKEQAAPKE